MQGGFISLKGKEWKVSFWKLNFKSNLQEHHFVYFYEVTINCYPSFITCLYFPLAFIRSNISHYQLMELFNSKESFKEKFTLDNNWKTAWSRMILEWHLFLGLSLRFIGKIWSFSGKHPDFTQKMPSFSVFLFKGREANLTSMSKKIYRKLNF